MSNAGPVICRCEMILTDAVREAIAEGNVTINDIKRRTRAGMGVCQGIYCNGAVADLLIANGVDASAIEPMTARPPMRMVSLLTAASSATVDE